MTRDLRTGPPRRWSDGVEGILWLPRLIDKARAQHAGTLGTYLYGQSPIDAEVLRTAGIGHRRFYGIVAQSPTDEGVVAAIETAAPGARERLQRWSARAPRRHSAFFFVLDVDDGYVTGPARFLKHPCNIASNALTWVLKRVWPFTPAKPEAS